MIPTGKNTKQGSNLPISIGWVLKAALAVAGVMVWGWVFLMAVSGLSMGFKILKSGLPCLASLLVLMALAALFIALLF